MLSRVGELLHESEPVERALDVCCGTGAGLQMLRPLCGECVVGIDFSRPMMAQARANLQEIAGTAGVYFVQADVFEMPFRSSFDLATCFGALGHILPRQEQDFVEQVAAALRPGGRFVFVTTRMPPLTSSRYWLSRGFNAAMRVRNLLVRPPFIMYYLTFLLPQIEEKLARAGFRVTVHEDIFPVPYREACIVVATKS